MTDEEQIWSEVYSALRMLGREYIEKIPNSEYNYVISNKSNEYNPVYTNDRTLEEQMTNQEALDIIEYFRFCYWSNEKEQEQIFQRVMTSNSMANYAKDYLWSKTLPEVQLKHTDTLLELLKTTERTVAVWKVTDDNVKNMIFVQIIQEITDEELIDKILKITNKEIVQKHLEVVPIIIKEQINRGKNLSISRRFILREILKDMKDKDEILKLVRENEDCMIEIFSCLNNDMKTDIVKDLIEECDNGDIAIKIWQECDFREIQQNNFDEIDYMLEKFPDLAKEIIHATSINVIINNFHNMIENEKIAIYVWEKTTYREEFQREKSEYLERLLDTYPDKIGSIIQGTNKNVQYENKDIIIKKIKDIKNKENLFSSYYHLDSRIKEENLDLFYLVLEANPEKMCEIWGSSISEEMIKNMLAEKDFIDRYQPILEQTIYDNKRHWAIWWRQPLDVQNKCKNIFRNLIKKYPDEFLKAWTRCRPEFVLQNIDLLFETMETHKNDAIELWNCIPKKARKTYIDRMIELNKENAQMVEKVWRKSADEELSEESLEKIFEVLYPEVKNVNETIENYKKIEKINASVKYKINLKMLDEKIVEDYSIYTIAQISNYEDIQEKFLQSVENPIRNKIMKQACKNNDDMIMTLNLLLENIEKNKDIIDTIENNDLKNDEIESIMTFLMCKNTNKIRELFEIKTPQDVINFKDIKREKCLEILENKDDTDESTKNKREAIFQLFFGISEKEALFLNDRYGNGINNSQSEVDIQEYLNLIKQFLNIQNDRKSIMDFFDKHKEEYLRGSYIWQNMNICKAQAQLNKRYSEIYQKSMYKIKQDDLLDKKEYYIDKDGNKKEISVYEIKEDFNMFVRSEGSYDRNWKEPENFREAINIPKIDYHGNCESFIGQDFIAVAKPKSVIYGYLNTNGMLLQAPYDLSSCKANTSFDAINGKTELPAKFMLPQEMINSTRHGHNEFTFERLNYDEKTEKLQKRMPECVIWIEEGEEKKDNERWRMTKKAASDLEVPIVIINRERFLIRETEKVQDMLEKFLNPKETNEEKINLSQTLTDIIIKFQNNYTGNRFATESLKEKYFTPEQREDILNKIETRIETIKRENPKEYYECIKTMKIIATSEIKKYTDASELTEYDWQSIMAKYEEKIEKYESTMKKANLNKSYEEEGVKLSTFNEISTSIKSENRGKSEVEK